MGGKAEGDLDCSRMHGGVLVPMFTTADSRTAVAGDMVGGCPLTGGGDQELSGNRPGPLGLATEWERLERLGLSLDVACMIHSTTVCYMSKWTAFQR